MIESTRSTPTTAAADSIAPTTRNYKPNEFLLTVNGEVRACLMSPRWRQLFDFFITTRERFNSLSLHKHEMSKKSKVKLKIFCYKKKKVMGGNSLFDMQNSKKESLSKAILPTF